MLQLIKIKDFALIEKAEIPFESGLNILSGETGAGKSIILDAISLLLGGRANSDVIRNGSDEAVVEGVFEVSELSWIQDRLAEVGIESDESEILIKRTLHRNGKNRIFINGQLATLAMLQRVCEGLVDLCGQHEHQSLFKSSVQLALLDRYTGIDAVRTKAQEQYQKTIALLDEWQSLQKKEEARMQRLDFLNFQIKELNEAALQSGEDEALTSEKKLLQSSKQRISLANEITSLLDDDEGVLNALKTVTNRARSLIQMDDSAEEILTRAEAALAETEEASRMARSYLDQSDLSPQRLDEVQERLSLITNLKRKYGQSVDEMISQHMQMQEELDLLENLSTRLVEIEKNFNSEKTQTDKMAKALFERRKKGAGVFAKSVALELKELRMADAQVEMSLAFETDLNQWGPESLGTRVSLEVQPNLGEEKKPIQKIVSGGELSRLMLAIRRVISDKGGIGVYLFDEIDAGLGGQTAFTVGKKLKSVAQYNQVICITHVPQVACFADHHLSIQKRVSKSRTVTEVSVLKIPERREEIARMLGTEKITPSALKNARDLMESASI